MQVMLETRSLQEIETEALVSYVFEEKAPVEGRIAELDQKMGGAIRRLAQSGELTGKALEMTLLHAPAGLKAQRVLLVGAGKREQYGTAQLRKVAGAAVRHLKARSVKNCVLLAREQDETESAAQAATEGMILGDFESDKYKTEKKNHKQMDAADSPAGAAPIRVRLRAGSNAAASRRPRRISLATS